MMTFSRTVSSLSRLSCCGTTPRRPRIVGPSASGSRPRTRSVPPPTGETEPIIRIVELFPAPFGPRKPKASPLLTSKSMPSTAVRPPKRFVRPRAWMSASFADTLRRYRRLQCLCDLRELVLVGEDDLDASARHLRVEARQPRERVTHARGERGIDRRCPHARPLLRAGPLCALLGDTDRQSLLHDLAREPPAALVVGDREHRACVSLAQLAALDHAEAIVGKVEQTDPVGHRRLRPTDPLGDVALRQPELVDERCVRARLLDRRQLLARDVLDEPEQRS